MIESGKKIAVLIVDDSGLIRAMFSDMLASEPDIEVCGTACDPYDAREKIKRLNPDVLTLDIEMPKMDGLSFLEKIMTLRPMPVIMASTLTQKGTEATVHALELGAVDYISKPQNAQALENLGELKAELVRKIRIAALANTARPRLTPSHPDKLIYAPKTSKNRFIIAIGSSTGGVETLRDIFARLPAGTPPIAITQHMPPNFTRSLAARLDSLSGMTVVEAENRMPLRVGHAYLAPGGYHLRLVKIGEEYQCRLDQGLEVSGHRPSVDALFESVAEAAGQDAVGVILTGMGKDGAAGMLKMRQNGAFTIGQNQASCIVYGMPKAARAVGAVTVELPLTDIPVKMLRYCESGGTSA